MTSFFNQYKGLFMDDNYLKIPSFTYPPKYNDNIFQFKLNQVQDKIKNVRRYKFPKSYLFENTIQDSIHKYSQESNINYLTRNRNMSLRNIQIENPILQIKQSKKPKRIVTYQKPPVKSSNTMRQQSIIKLPQINQNNSQRKRFQTESSKYGNYVLNYSKSLNKQLERKDKNNYHNKNQLSFDNYKNYSTQPNPQQQSFKDYYSKRNQNKINFNPVTNKPTYTTQQKSIKSEPNYYLTPQLNRKHQKRHITQEQSEPLIFVQFDDENRQVNNYQFLNKRMHDLKKIDRYYDRQKLNHYTDVLIRRREVQKDPARKQKLKSLLQKQQHLSNDNKHSVSQLNAKL